MYVYMYVCMYVCKYAYIYYLYACMYIEVIKVWWVNSRQRLEVIKVRCLGWNKWW